MTVFVVPYENTEWISGVGEAYRLANWKKLVGNIEPDVEHKQKLMVQLVPEPENQYDNKAVALHVNGIHVGYLAGDIASKYFKTILPIYKEGNAIVAYGSIWVVSRGGELNANVSVNLPKKISVPELLTLETAPDQPTRSPASKVSNEINFPVIAGGAKTTSGTVSERIAADPKATKLLSVFKVLLKVFVVLVVAVIAQAITGSAQVSQTVIIIGALWIIFEKKIKAFIKSRKK
jgi:hypothetical protein